MAGEWPGEKLDLWDANVATGAHTSGEIWLALRFEEPDTGGSLTLVAGDDVWVWSDSTSLLRDTDTIGVCNWVVTSDGDGDVEIYTGHDPLWTGSEPTDWVLAASGVSAGRNFIPLPDADRTFDWLGGVTGGLALRLRVVSGSVSIAQVHLQVEPPGGLLVQTGYEWSDYRTPELVAKFSDLQGGYAGTGYFEEDLVDRAAALDIARSGGGNIPPDTAPLDAPPISYFHSHADGDAWTGTHGIDGFSYDRALSQSLPTPHFTYTTVWLQVGYSGGLWKERPDLRQLPDFMAGLTPGRDYVTIDDFSTAWSPYGEFAAGDTDAVEWQSLDVTIVFHASGETEQFGATVGVTNSDLFGAPVLDWTATSWPPPTASGTHVDPPVVPPFDGEIETLTFPAPPAGSDFTVTIYGDLFTSGVYPPTGDPADSGWQEWHALADPFINYQMPDFRYHVPVFEPDPDAANPYPDPRFFVKHPYGLMVKFDVDGNPVKVDPVGFGVPEGARVYRIPTATGMYRDLTKAEYQALAPGERPAGALPLKVKRATGWDQVAWMVPDR